MRALNELVQRRATAITVLFALVLAACGGGDTEGSGSDDMAAGESSGGDNGSSSGEVVNPQPAGQAMALVDGHELIFDMPAEGSDCIIESNTLTFGFLASDNSGDLAGGANLTDDGWLGNIAVRTTNDEGQPIRYYPDEGAMDGGVAIDGDSMSFSGPMLMQPPNDGSNPPPVAVGDGTISVTC